MGESIVLSGTANPPLAATIASLTGVRLGACEVERFPDGEVSVRLLESVRGKEVFVVQPTSPPVNDHLVELLAFADACRRAAAGRVTAVVPYFGYGRSDKRHGRREPIMASVVAVVLEAMSIDRLVTVDLHTIQVEGFFHVPVDTLTAVGTLCDALEGRLPEEAAVVSPDAGRVPLATAYAQRLRRPLAVLHKRRTSGESTHVSHVVGDVSGRPCLLVDDMIATGGTLVESIKALRDAGATGFFVAATHGLLLGEARDRLGRAGVEEVLVTDTVPVHADDLVRVATIAPLLATALQELSRDGSLQPLR